MDIRDVFDVDVRVLQRIRRDGVVATLAPMAARRGAVAAVASVGGAAAASVAYAGVGGTLLQAGVAVGLCSPPVLVAAVPFVACAAGFAAARVARRYFPPAKRR